MNDCFLGDTEWTHSMELFLDCCVLQRLKKSRMIVHVLLSLKVPLGRPMTQHYAICLSKSPAVFNSHQCVGKKIWKHGCVTTKNEILKGEFTQKWKFCHLLMFPTCMILFLLLRMWYSPKWRYRVTRRRRNCWITSLFLFSLRTKSILVAS